MTLGCNKDKDIVFVYIHKYNIHEWHITSINKHEHSVHKLHEYNVHNDMRIVFILT